MKKIIITLLSMLVVISALSANGSQEYQEYGYGQGNGQGQGLRDGQGRGAGNGTGRGNSTGVTYREDFIEELSTVYHGSLGSGVLTDEDKAGFNLMVEEEQLARDVYAKLYETWNLPIFRNISESEQQHMDSVKLLMEAYGLSEAGYQDVPGSFRDNSLETLYNKLIEDGSKSLSEALKVGALVEDLDIADLQKLLEKTDNEEIKILYQNLMKGSRNHLRSFTAQLNREGLVYDPTYITDEYYNRIIMLNREIAPIGDPDYSL